MGASGVAVTNGKEVAKESTFLPIIYRKYNPKPEIRLQPQRIRARKMTMTRTGIESFFILNNNFKPINTYIISS
jgi:hypothetical protein